ncbi:MAG: hypothetical protein K6U14_02365 [Firmicutes bacterium]|nr:hypothetical protein [Alicyclobacillaceae bacterium]MCL6496465.1 hypothetical protein [Bacillota bacterium]
MAYGLAPVPRRRRISAAVLAVLAVLAVWGPGALALRRTAYATLTAFTAVVQASQTVGDSHLMVPHFVIAYPPGDRAAAWVVARGLEQAWPLEAERLGQAPPFPLPVMVYSQPAAMNRAVGVRARDRDLGFYWNGAIRVVAPQVWPGPGPGQDAVFLRQGPVAHELGHAMLAFAADGNYPDWFNEGMAQVLDTAVTGWSAPRPPGPLYPPNALEMRFYTLPNQAMAYWEADQWTRFLLAHGGWPRLRRLIQRLAAGEPFNQALAEVYPWSSPAALDAAWLDGQ